LTDKDKVLTHVKLVKKLTTSANINQVNSTAQPIFTN